MATYTVTRVITRPNTSTQWPREALGLSGDWDDEDVTVSTSFDSDNLVQTSSYVWASKADYINNLRDADDYDSTLNTKQNQYNTYMALNNIEGEVTEEDGTVKVFNSSNNTWEVEQKLK